jgi:hypothetical protein
VTEYPFVFRGRATVEKEEKAAEELPNEFTTMGLRLFPIPDNRPSGM